MNYTRLFPKLTHVLFLAGIGISSSTHAGRAPAQDWRSVTAEEGEASYYGDNLIGRPTASGEAYNPDLLTAAHRSFPMGSNVVVSNMATGQSVLVRVNDRGPFHSRRIIDVSRAAAHELGMIGKGTTRVRLSLMTE